VKEFLTEVRAMMDQIERGEEDFAGWVSRSKTIESFSRIPGDASTRRYYRVGSSGVSYIAMRMEVFTAEGASLPFLAVQKHLKAAGVDVPQVLDMDPARGFILLEDLGDVTLLRRLQGVSSSEVERHLFEGVIDSLVGLQFHASPKRSKTPIEAFNLRFDHKKLMWEVNHTIEHFYDTFLKRQFFGSDRRIMVDGFSDICTLLDQQPTVFTHRDFHSRNIMIAPAQPRERWVMIDFQDARMGPAQYDLASLLKDSYYQLEEAQITRLLDYYIVKWEAVSGERLDRDLFLRIFDLMSVQRNFKAIGSFASFLNRRGDPSYLKFIGNTFENIRRALLKYPEYAQLREVLFHYYYF